MVAVAVAATACMLDRPTGPSLLAPEAHLAVDADKYGGGNNNGGKGGGDTGFGNNLSVPVIFAEGIGLTGANVLSGTTRLYANTGLRPTLALEPLAYAELSANDALPFWYSGNDADPGGSYDVFWQKTANTWQAEWEGRPGGNTHVLVDWGDNLRSASLRTTSVIRVEHVLVANDATLLLGFPHDTVVNPSSANELQGIFEDGNESDAVSMTPSVYSSRARLTIQKLAAQGGAVTFTYFNEAAYDWFNNDGAGGYGAELNVGGRVVYGYVWDMKKVVMPPGVEKDGWWRITFTLDAPSGVTIDGVAAGDDVFTSYTSAATVGEVFLTSKGGGKKP